MPIPEPDLTEIHPVVRDRIEARRQTAEADGTGDAWGELGMLYHAYYLLDAARASYENAARLDSRDARWPYLEGLALSVVAESQQEAVAAFERAREIDPDEPLVHVRLGDLYHDLGRFEEARQAFLRALEIDPSLAAALYGLGRVEAETGDPQAAVARFRQVLEDHPEAGLVHYRLGQAYRALGRSEEAAEHLERRSEQGVPIEDPLLTAVRRLDRETANDMVEALAADPGRMTAEELTGFALGQYRDLSVARREVESLHARADDPTAAARLGAVLGTLLARQGELPAAQRALEKALAGELPATDRPAALARQADLELAQGDATAALAGYRQALELDPGYVPGRLALAALLGRAGRFEEAAQEYRRAAEAEPENETARLGEATALILAGRHAEAARRLEAAVAALPGSIAVKRTLARHLAASPDLEARRGERALELAREVFAAEATLDNAETLAMAMAEAGRFEEAVETQRQIVEGAREQGAGPEVLRRLEGNLARYRARQTCCG